MMGRRMGAAAFAFVLVVSAATAGVAVGVPDGTTPGGDAAAVDGEEVADTANATGNSIIGFESVGAGTTRDVSVDIELRSRWTRLEGFEDGDSVTFTVTVHHDTGTECEFEYVEGNGTEDRPYERDGSAVDDDAVFTVDTAEVTLNDARVENDSSPIIVESVYLPEGGAPVVQGPNGFGITWGSRPVDTRTYPSRSSNSTTGRSARS